MYNHCFCIFWLMSWSVLATVLKCFRLCVTVIFASKTEPSMFETDETYM